MENKCQYLPKSNANSILKMELLRRRQAPMIFESKLELKLIIDKVNEEKKQSKFAHQIPRIEQQRK